MKSQDLLYIGSSNNSRPKKRLQVPRACMNCRKMHTGCETERPCKRCVQHGLECVDLPRKKRFTRTKKHRSESHALVVAEHRRSAVPSLPSIPALPSTDPLLAGDGISSSVIIQEVSEEDGNVHNVQIEEVSADDLVNSEIPEADADAGKVWEKPEVSDALKLWDPSNDDWSTDTKELGWESNTQLSPYNNNWNNFKTISDQFTLFNGHDIFGEYGSNNEILPFATTAPKSISSAPQVAQLSQPGLSNVSNMELNMLIQQISELKENNKLLEGKLQQAVESLSDSRNKQPWHCFGIQSDDCLSIWSRNLEGKYVLSQCNNKFVESTGYSINFLQNNFNFSKIFIGVQPSDKDFPKQAQIITSTGHLQEVNISISSLENDSIVVHMHL